MLDQLPADILDDGPFPLFVFVLGTTIAFVAPKVAQFTWCLAFLAPMAGWLAGRHAR